MLSTLITSKSRVEILTWFVTHPGERFHYRQLEKLLKVSTPSIRRELKRLEGSGLLLSTREANVRFYWINQEHLLYPEIKSIVFKTAGLADFLRQALGELGQIEVAFIFGSVAKNLEDSRSDIDLMVIGDVDMDKLHDAVANAEKAISREINYSTFDAADWRKQLKEKKAFVNDVAKGDKIYLIGTEDDLRKIA